MTLLPWLVFLAAAALEVAGDAIIRHGLRGTKFALVVAGAAVLASYALLVNSLKWDFSKLLGVYVGFFATVSVFVGWLVFREKVPTSTWLGLIFIMAGCLIIQFGHR
jgi:multidrug transporter EmrE-like cation transporter